MNTLENVIRTHTEYPVDKSHTIPLGSYKSFKKNYIWTVLDDEDYNDDYYYCAVWKSGEKAPINIPTNDYNRNIPNEFLNITDNHIFPYGSILSSVNLPTVNETSSFAIYIPTSSNTTRNNNLRLEIINTGIVGNALDFQIYKNTFIWSIFPAFYSKFHLPEGYPIFDIKGEVLVGFVGGRLTNNTYSAIITPIQTFFHPIDSNDIMINVQLWESPEKTNVYGNNFIDVSPNDYIQLLTSNSFVDNTASGSVSSIPIFKRFNFILFHRHLLVTGTNSSNNDVEKQLFYTKISFPINTPILTYKKLTNLDEVPSVNATNLNNTSVKDEKKKGGSKGKKKTGGIRWFFKRQSIIEKPDSSDDKENVTTNDRGDNEVSPTTE